MPKFNHPKVSYSARHKRRRISPDCSCVESSNSERCVETAFTSSTLTTICFGGSEDVKRFVLFVFIFVRVTDLSHITTHIHRLKAQVGNTSSDNLSWLRFDMDLQRLRSCASKEELSLPN